MRTRSERRVASPSLGHHQPGHEAPRIACPHPIFPRLIIHSNSRSRLVTVVYITAAVTSGEPASLRALMGIVPDRALAPSSLTRRLVQKATGPSQWRQVRNDNPVPTQQNDRSKATGPGQWRRVRSKSPVPTDQKARSKATVSIQWRRVFGWLQSSHVFPILFTSDSKTMCWPGFHAVGGATYRVLGSG